MSHTWQEDCDIVLALCLLSDCFILLAPRRNKNPMAKTKNNPSPTDMQIAAISRVESSLVAPEISNRTKTKLF